MGTVAYNLKPASSGRTEFDILRQYHRFLREEGERPENWNDALAEKYYSSLWREFTVCDLKHYKTGNFALRWRTEDEVLSGAGETTCANARCAFHEPPNPRDVDRPPMPSLLTVELPFGYIERGESKSALVKVVLCGKCLKKLMWKREKEKEARKVAGIRESENVRRPDEEDQPIETTDTSKRRPRREERRDRESDLPSSSSKYQSTDHRRDDRRSYRVRDNRSQSPPRRTVTEESESKTR